MSRTLNPEQKLDLLADFEEAVGNQSTQHTAHKLWSKLSKYLDASTKERVLEAWGEVDISVTVIRIENIFDFVDFLDDDWNAPASPSSSLRQTLINNGTLKES